MFERTERTTRRRSSAGPTGPIGPIAPQRPQPRPRLRDTPGPIRRSDGRIEGRAEGGSPGARPTFLALRDHGKVYVADLPRLSDGQLSQIAKEAQEVLDSLNRRLHDLDDQLTLSQLEQDTRIRATTKRDVTERVLAAIAQEQELRRSNPALRTAAGESLARAFLELARHRLPGATFDSLLQEALAACAPEAGQRASDQDPQVIQLLQRAEAPQPPQAALPVVLTPDPSTAVSA